jgi:hypothetical protein
MESLCANFASLCISLPISVPPAFVRVGLLLNQWAKSVSKKLRKTLCLSGQFGTYCTPGPEQTQ